MSLKRKLYLSILGAVLLSGQASAALLNADWKTAGDNYISKDSESNLGWLDLTLTKGMSLNQVIAQLGNGGLFESFRLPSQNEIFTLMSNLSKLAVNETNKLVSVPHDITQSDAYGYLSNGHVPMFGWTYRVATQYSARGMYLNQFGNVAVSYIMQRSPVNFTDYVVSGSTYTYAVDQPSLGITPDTGAQSLGVWLVKDMSVASVNSTFAGMSLISLLLLAGTRVRKSNSAKETI